MDWIVEKGVEKIPDGVSFDTACFVEPVNTCLKGVVQCDPQPDDLCVVMGQGPIGMLFTMILKQRGLRTVTTDTMEQRRALSLEFGAVPVGVERRLELGEQRWGAPVRQTNVPLHAVQQRAGGEIR